VRQRRRGHEPATAVDEHGDTVGGEDLHRGARGRLGERVRILAQEQRAGGALLAPVLGDRRADRDDVVFVERRVQRRPTVPRRSEADLFGDVRHIGMPVEVGGADGGRIDEVARFRTMAGARVDRHGKPPGGRNVTPMFPPPGRPTPVKGFFGSG
jgi:hypothetical protein